MPRRRQDRDGIYERPNSPYYWASYVDVGGERVRRSTGIQKSTEGRKEAEALIVKWRLEVHRQKQWDEQPEHSFDELMLAYLQGPSTEKRAAERDRYSAKRLYAFFSGRTLLSLTASDMRAYINKRKVDGVQVGTINREIGLLSAALNWARRELDWDIANPAQGRRLREPVGRVRWITREEAQKLLETAAGITRAPHLVDFIRLGLHTGMRSGEMLGLAWRRVDLQAGLIYLEAGDQKNGKLGSVPLNREAREAILAREGFRSTHCPLSPWVFCNAQGERIAAIKRSFTSACAQAGISDFHPHDLRHTCAAWLVQAGVPIIEVRELLRHSTVTMTERYAHLAPHNVRQAVSALETSESHSGHTGPERRLRLVR